MADIAISGSDNPYRTGSYTPESNDKNTISMTGYFKLLAAQLQNQDMTNPMDNSELMSQMTQMAMVQSLTSMTQAIETSTSATTQTYAGSLLGQEVTMAVTEEKNGIEIPVGVKYGIVESVDFASGAPVVRLQGDTKKYQLAHVVGVGQVPDPYKKEDEENTDEEDTGNTDKVEGDKNF